MKILRFLDKIQEIIQCEPDIHLRTYKLIIDEFSKCLSKKEKERFMFTINLLLKYNNTQESILRAIKKAKNYKPSD